MAPSLPSITSNRYREGEVACYRIWSTLATPATSSKAISGLQTPPQRILHPHNDPIADHLAETEQGTLVSRTPTGAFHIQRLRLNRPLLVQHRLELRRRELEQARTQELLWRLEQLEARIQSLTSELQQEN